MNKCWMGLSYQPSIVYIQFTWVSSRIKFLFKVITALISFVHFQSTWTTLSVFSIKKQLQKARVAEIRKKKECYAHMHKMQWSHKILASQTLQAEYLQAFVRWELSVLVSNTRINYLTAALTKMRRLSAEVHTKCYHNTPECVKNCLYNCIKKSSQLLQYYLQSKQNCHQLLRSGSILGSNMVKCFASLGLMKAVCVKNDIAHE